MKIYQLSREFYPYANAGGLKEVVTGIAESLVPYKINSSVFIPCYGFINKNEFILKDKFVLSLNDKEINIDVYYRLNKGVNIYLFSYPIVENKSSVYTYIDDDESFNPEFKRGEGFIDNDDINIILQLAFLKYVSEYLDTPDIINLHDGHTGLIPVIIKSNPFYIERFRTTKIYFTIHNAGIIYHQRIICKKIRSYNVINKDLLCEGCFGGEVDPICLAVLHSKPLTVSPYYAKEILSLQHEESSGGFGAFCKSKNISIEGITNGVDINHYAKLSLVGLPSIDFKISVRKKINNDYIFNTNLKSWGDLIIQDNKPLFIFQNRITEQKGIDKFILAIKNVLAISLDMKFIVMGQGEVKYEDLLIELAKEFPHNICFLQGYDEVVALNLFVSSDFFVLTSIWEPCGLTDFEAQLAGSIPIVHYTGGLKKVINNETGFTYNEFSEIENIILKCVELYNNDKQTLEKIKHNAYENITENYTWAKVVLNKYIPMFKN